MDDLLTNAGQAAIAYQDALNQARNAQNALFARYGYTMPNASGGYDSKSAGEAFDPNVLYDKSTGKVDEDKLKQMFGQMQMGGSGLLADITRGGASSEASAVGELQSRGFGGDIGGGLVGQRRQLAESQTSGQLGAAKSDYLSQFAQANQPIGGAYQDLQTAINEDKIKAGEAEALKNSTAVTPAITPASPEITPPVAGVDPPAAPTGPYSTKGTPGGNFPRNPNGGTKYTGPGGVKWQYRINGPTGKGWYK